MMEESYKTAATVMPPVEAATVMPPVEAASGDAGRRTALLVAVLATVATSVLYFAWWFRGDRLSDPWLVLGLCAVAGYVVVQVYCACYVYLQIRAPETPPPPPGLTVDVFVPVYDEAYELVEQSLRAALAIRYPHRTFLLDDARCPRFAQLAEELGVEYRTRDGNGDAKAGNVNAALAASDAELVTIFDVDHIPRPDYLDGVLGHFRDPEVGFVQSAVGFSNGEESWIAQASVEQSNDAHGPTSMGMHGCDAAQVWGSHCTFRRSALESIGGHQTGLAEDLHTSIRCHAAGWKSVFVPTLRAWGLVPSDLPAASKQQFKWARGVFEVLLKVYPKVWPKLSLAQNLAYAVRLTYYLIGVVFLAHALVAGGVVAFGSAAARAAFGEYLLGAVPFAISVLLVRYAALAVWAGRAMPPGLNWRGYLHTLQLWPVHAGAFLLALLRIPVGHISTPKERATGLHLLAATPQLALLVLLLGAVALRCVQGLAYGDLVPTLFALAAAGTQLCAAFNVCVPSEAHRELD